MPEAGRTAGSATADAGDAEAFGVELVLNLYGCDPAAVRSADRLAAYVRGLCDLIGMRRHGELIAERFALHDPKAGGYTIVQLIETSSITGHFSEQRNSAYLNVFSCRRFDVDAAAEYSRTFFGAASVERHVLTRR